MRTTTLFMDQAINGGSATKINMAIISSHVIPKQQVPPAIFLNLGHINPSFSMDSQTKYKSQGIILKILRLSLPILEARPATTHQPVISPILAVILIILSTKTTILITIKVSMWLKVTLKKSTTKKTIYRKGPSLSRS